MTKWVNEVQDACRRGHQFVTRDVWHIGAPGEAVPSGMIIKQIRAVVLLLRGIVAEENLWLRSSALTFATLLFIVPFLAFTFFLIQTFNLGDDIYRKLNEQIEMRVEAAVKLFDDQKGVDWLNTPRAAAGEGSLEGVEEGQREGAPEVTAAAQEAVAEGEAQALPQERRSTPEEARRRNEELEREILGLIFPIFTKDKTIAGNANNPVNFLVQQAQQAVQRPSAVGVVGLLFVISTVFGFMRNVEFALNSIWGVQQTRNIFRALNDYMLITLLLPFGAATVLGVNAALENNYVASHLGGLSMLLRAGPFIIIWMTACLLYYFVPNTKVQFRYAIPGAFVATVVWSVFSWGFMRMWFKLPTYENFYFGLALIPMFLLWIYFSWMILLSGALLTFAYQNEATFALERLAGKASYAYREALSVRLLSEISRRFQRGLGGITVGPTAAEWNVPARLLNETLDILVTANLVTACATEPVTYQPARATDTITLGDVVRAMRDAGCEPSLLREDPSYRAVFLGLETGLGVSADTPVSLLIPADVAPGDREPSSQEE